MTKVTMEYLQANGRYRRAVSNTESQWPNFLINHQDKQAHSLVDSPVFPVDRRPARFTDWESFLTSTPPVAKHYPDKMLAVCEDQNIWPVCGDMMPDIQDRQMQFKEFAEDAEQNAVASATRSAEGNGLMTAWSIASLMIFCIVSAVIVLIVLQSKLAQDLIPGMGEPTAALLALTGLVLPFRRRKPLNDDSGAIKSLLPSLKERRAALKKHKDFETVRVWDETSNSVWSASLPLEVIRPKIPLECRYTQELTTARYTAMGFFGGLAYLVSALIGTASGLGLMWGLIAPVPVALIGVIYGYIAGFGMFMLPPIWIVRRMYERTPVDANDERKGYRINYDALPVIVPELHTKLTGMPINMAIEERRASAEAVIRAISGGQSNGKAGIATITRENMAVAYTPRIWRASMLYEMLKGRDIKARMRGPASKGDKIQKISMAGMALGSVGLLILALLFM